MVRKIVALIILFFFVATSNYGWAQIKPSVHMKARVVRALPLPKDGDVNYIPTGSIKVKDVSESESVSLFDIFDIAKEIKGQTETAKAVVLPSNYLKYIEKGKGKDTELNLENCKNINVNYETASFNDKMKFLRCAYLISLDNLLLSPISSDMDPVEKNIAELLTEMLVFPDEEIRSVAKDILFDFFRFENIERLFRNSKQETEAVYLNTTVYKDDAGKDFVMRTSLPIEERNRIYNKIYPELALLINVIKSIKVEIPFVNFREQLVALEPQLSEIASVIKKFELAAAKDKAQSRDLLEQGAKGVYWLTRLNPLVHDSSVIEEEVKRDIEDFAHSKEYNDLRSYQESDEYQEQLLYKQLYTNIIDSLCFFYEISQGNLQQDVRGLLVDMASKDDDDLVTLLYGPATVEAIQKYSPKWMEKKYINDIAYEADYEYKQNPYWGEFQYDTKVRPLIISQLVISAASLGITAMASYLPRFANFLKGRSFKFARNSYKTKSSQSIIARTAPDIKGTGTPFSSNPIVQYNNPTIGASSGTAGKNVAVYAEVPKFSPPSGNTINYFDAVKGTNTVIAPTEVASTTTKVTTGSKVWTVPISETPSAILHPEVIASGNGISKIVQTSKFYTDASKSVNSEVKLIAINKFQSDITNLLEGKVLNEADLNTVLKAFDDAHLTPNEGSGVVSKIKKTKLVIAQQKLENFLVKYGVDDARSKSKQMIRILSHSDVKVLAQDDAQVTQDLIDFLEDERILADSELDLFKKFAYGDVAVTKTEVDPLIQNLKENPAVGKGLDEPALLRTHIDELKTPDGETPLTAEAKTAALSLINKMPDKYDDIVKYTISLNKYISSLPANLKTTTIPYLTKNMELVVENLVEGKLYDAMYNLETVFVDVTDRTKYIFKTTYEIKFTPLIDKTALNRQFGITPTSSFGNIVTGQVEKIRIKAKELDTKKAKKLGKKTLNKTFSIERVFNSWINDINSKSSVVDIDLMLTRGTFSGYNAGRPALFDKQINIINSWFFGHAYMDSGNRLLFAFNDVTGEVRLLDIIDPSYHDVKWYVEFVKYNNSTSSAGKAGTLKQLLQNY